METIKHLWNVNQFITKLKCPLVTDLQMFYMQKCKNFSNSIELPEQNFGPSTACSHCGSLWSTVDHQVRIARSRKMSKSVKKIIRYIKENPDQKIPKIRATLAQKSIKNEMNRLVIKCSVCSKNTELPFKKKNHLKPVKLNNSQMETPQSNRKKKKKKSKDKTAGLNISGCMPALQLNKKDNNVTPTTSSAITPKIISSNKKSISSKKSKKLNIERLKRIMENKTPSKTKNLHSFLAELR
ncbi:hypothetical protein ALC56_14190 [Trachymyrmex septentrionalis]|uniref:Uncharacterized protein n=1 Tax=Trachymyrmex septentrionalis TaxID=34720 RepID=A0A195ETV3_9HYME|nr:PREDICTED: uncharacterized protein LOC108755238 [Trachymyrmex septentrionalis]KYN31309.1 hypothetical protein ALC56_14190 [Trachymyrmex septentrionalis]